MRKKYVTLIIKNLVFCFVLIFLYSPGFVGLSPVDESIFKSILAVWVGIMAIPFFLFINRSLFKKEKRELIGTNDRDGKSATDVIESYCSSRVFGKIASSAMNQIGRIQKIEENFEKIMSKRFGKGTLSYQKFMGVINSSSRAFSDGYTKIANTMMVFDESEYEKLLRGDYRNDAIPDDIQEKKLSLYNKNVKTLQMILEKNEALLLHLENLMMEITNAEYDDDSVNGTINDISDLLTQLDFYKKQ